MTQHTPMIEQYLLIKAEAKDAFLFFRLGDFYELFFEDAVLASRELEITLTARGGGGERQVPMCGVPHHAAEGYISQLIAKGYKVAICEQVENPAEAKGIVRREIVRIVTPGTVMEGKTLGESANNFIVCLASGEPEWAIAACDLTTGELYVTSIECSLTLLMDEVNVYNPSELIGDGDLVQSVQSELANGYRSALFTEWNQLEPSLMEQHFAQSDLDKLTFIQDRVVCLLLSYLNETQKRSFSHLRHIRVYEQKQFMTLDPFTRRNLELTETVRERTKKGSLLWLLDKTVTSMGGRMLRRWIDKPLMNKSLIEQRLEAVDILYHQLILRDDLRQQLKEVYDLERLAGRIAFGNANARDLLALKISLQQVPELARLCTTSSSETLQQLMLEVDDCRDVLASIDAAIVDDPPVSIRDGGMIKQGYHTYLDQLREASVHGKQWIAELEKQEREATGIRSLKIGYNKVFGYYIEVTKANIASLPEHRYERKQTLANAERYITPELKEKEALILDAEEKMVDIEAELFTELRTQIATQTMRLQQLAEMIAAIDVYQSLATVSATHHYRKPSVTEGYDLILTEGRHPVVEAIMDDGSFIANDTQLVSKEGKVLLITGPNMAGKSTYMRQVALICIMAQIGCFVPAETAQIPITDRIFTRIGAADDLISGQSTFMVEMMDIQVMTAKATSRSLVIIDELGRGTSTGEGMAIAQAVIEFIHEKIGSKTLVSTHFHELAHLEESLAHLRNYCMAVRESGDQVTFLRKLVNGAASSSYGIYCAQIAGLPQSIIARSYVLLNGFEARDSMHIQEEAATQPIVQLSLFADIEQVEGKGQKNKDTKLEHIIEQLHNVDLLNMTPLQAINFVHELKRKL